MTEQAYRRPPITEAVIDFRFVEPVEKALVTKVSEALGRSYETSNTFKNLTVQVIISDDGVSQKPAGARETFFRLATRDQTELLSVSRSFFTISQLPDYPGWPTLFSRFVRDWEIWKRIVGYRRIGRIGVRYINRIDLPWTGPAVFEEDFISFNIRSPDMLGDKFAYAAQAGFSVPQIKASAMINSGLVPSPLSQHMSFMLDIDVSRIVDIPSKDEDLYELLGEIRAEKNRIFELCITDKAREVFDRE